MATVRYHGRLAELTGCREESLEGTNVSKVLVESFGIAGIGTVEDDLELFFGKESV